MVLSGPFPHFLTENNSVEETESTKNMVVVFLPKVIYSYQAQHQALLFGNSTQTLSLSDQIKEPFNSSGFFDSRFISLQKL